MGSTRLELVYVRGLVVLVARACPFHPAVVGYHQLELLAHLQAIRPPRHPVCPCSPHSQHMKVPVPLQWLCMIDD
jgi:hypothetical protein